MKIPKWLKLQEQIDLHYFLLGRILEKYKKMLPKSGLEKMIDEATGYNKKRLTDFEKEIKPICLKINRLRQEYEGINN